MEKKRRHSTGSPSTSGAESKKHKLNMSSNSSTIDEEEDITDIDARIKECVDKQFEALKQNLKQTLSILLQAKLKKLEKRTEVLEKEKKSLKENFEQLDEKYQSVMKKNAELHEAVNNVEAHSVELEQYSRQANVRVFGVPAEREENTKQVMMKILNSVMKVEINNSDIVAVHRLLGKPGKPRPIIVRFINKDLKHEVIRERKRLSGHKIGMQDDLCQGLQTTLNRLQNSESIKKAGHGTINYILKITTARYTSSSMDKR